MSFLEAEWRKLVIVNYVIDPNILSDYIPYGTELDLWQDKCYISLVGFMFLNTKLKGIKIPFHTNFEEVNLRFYVRRRENNNWKRGVVFIKEIVPKRALALVANSIYNENYQVFPMQHQWSENTESRSVSYQWKTNGRWQQLTAEADIESSEIKTNSETEFITEHYWGYAKVNDTTTNEYEVTHPKWETYNVTNFNIEIDYEAVYGKEFVFLNDKEPVSVKLAEGSPITIENKRVIKAEGEK